MFSVLKELELNKIHHTVSASGTAKIRCPFHKDETPSCFITVADGKWKCMSAACRSKGDFFGLISKITGKSRATVVAEISSRYNLNIERSIDPDIIQKWVDALWIDQPLLAQLHKRAVADNIIRRYSLGKNMDRISIPIFTSDWIAVNAKFYRPGAPSHTAKMIGQIGRSRDNRLYPADQLLHDRLILAGGEIKALAVISHLEGSDYGAVSTIQGEGTWSPKFNEMLRGKTVYVAMDVDEAGQIATEKLCKLMYNICETYVLQYELDRDVYPKGGIDDFIATGGDLLKTLDKAVKYHPSIRPKTAPEKIITDVRAFKDVSLINKEISMRALVSAVDSNQYAIPGKVKVVCPADKNYCAVCRVPTTKPPIIQLDLGDATIGMIGANRLKLEAYVKEAAGIPQCCRVCTLHVLEHRNAVDTRVTSRVDVSSADATVNAFRCVFLDTGEIEVNSSYEMGMSLHPHPDTQQVTGLVQSVQPLEDSLSIVPPETLPLLKTFQAEHDDCESILSRLAYIADAMSRDVTRIFKRTDMHILADLVWHSALLIRYNDIDTKGWLDACVLGDSAQGKSEYTLALIKHYQMGTRVECKNATVAGLLGGLQQMANRWFTVWGVLPQNDKRLVVMEELKGAETQVISKLTDGRSSGIAQLPKIERKIAYMRTRILSVSNPRRDIALGQYPFGVLAIKELYGALEDVRRLDAAICVSANDVTADQIRLASIEPRRDPVEFPSDLCKALVTWTWTRTRAEVVITHQAYEECECQAVELSNVYSNLIPLIDSGSIRLKLARLSTAIAGRLFSCDDGMTQIIVKRCHVQAARALLDRWYKAPACGYEAFSATLKQAEDIQDATEVIKCLKDLRYSKHVIHYLKNTIEFNDRDIQDISGLDRVMANDLISILVRNHCIRREQYKNTYSKTPAFGQLLKDLNKGNKPEDRADEF